MRKFLYIVLLSSSLSCSPIQVPVSSQYQTKLEATYGSIGAALPNHKEEIIRDLSQETGTTISDISMDPNGKMIATLPAFGRELGNVAGQSVMQAFMKNPTQTGAVDAGIAGLIAIYTLWSNRKKVSSGNVA